MTAGNATPSEHELAKLVPGAHRVSVVETVNGWRAECSCGDFGPLFTTENAANRSLCARLAIR